MEKCFRALDHTGDLGVEVWGQDWPSLFENACLALVDSLAEIESIQPLQHQGWLLEAETRETLLVHQLEEILYRMDAEGMVFSKFRIKMPDAQGLICEAWGEPLDRNRHGFKTELKAVTYHELKLWQELDGRCLARIIFDV